MSKVITINEEGKPELMELEHEKKCSCKKLMKTVDLIHDGIDDLYDWKERGEEYHEYVVESFTHALSGISILEDELEELAKSCPKMMEAYRQYKS